MKKKTSILIDSDLWSDLKVFCIQNEKQVSATFEKAIYEYLKGNTKFPLKYEPKAS